MIIAYRVVNNEFNRAWYSHIPGYIGSVRRVAPSYTAVQPMTFVDLAAVFYQRMVARTYHALTHSECEHLCDYALGAAVRWWRMYKTA